MMHKLVGKEVLSYLLQKTESYIMLDTISQNKSHFLVLQRKEKLKDLIPIYMRVWNHYEYFNKSIGLFVKQADWDKKGMKVRGTGANTKLTNSQLEGLKHKVILII